MFHVLLKKINFFIGLSIETSPEVTCKPLNWKNVGQAHPVGTTGQPALGRRQGVLE